jgi:hypothetical protein
MPDERESETATARALQYLAEQVGPFRVAMRVGSMDRLERQRPRVLDSIEPPPPPP